MTTSQEAFPLSFQQLRQWFLNRLRPASTAYNMVLAMRLRGDLDEDRLLAAVEQVLWKHPVLRTGYIPCGAEPRQVVSTRVADLTRELGAAQPLTGLGPSAADDAVAAAVAERVNQPFDLADGAPPIRVRRYRLAAADSVLALCVHHIAFDAASGALVMSELASAYAELDGSRAPLTGPVIDGGAGYAEYARAQRQRWSGPSAEEAANFWRSELTDADLTPLALRALPSSPPLSSATVHRYGFRLDPASTARVGVFAERTGSSLFAVSLAVTLAWIALYTGSPRPVVGVPVSCRDQPGAEGLVGCFINTLLVGCQVADDDGLIDVVERSRDALSRAMSYREFPLEKVLQSLDRARSKAPDDIPGVLLTVNPVQAADVRIGDAHTTLLALPPASPQVDLSVIIQGGDVLEGWIDVRDGCVGSWSGAEIGGHFTRLFRLLADDPAAQIIDIEIMTQRERAGLATLWNGTPPAAGRAGTAPDRNGESNDRANRR